jgi:hypothetical protein
MIDHDAKAAVGSTGPIPPPFHLSNKDQLLQRFKKAGFSSVFAWYTVRIPKLFRLEMQVISYWRFNDTFN